MKYKIQELSNFIYYVLNHKKEFYYFINFKIKCILV